MLEESKSNLNQSFHFSNPHNRGDISKLAAELEKIAVGKHYEEYTKEKRKNEFLYRIGHGMEKMSNKVYLSDVTKTNKVMSDILEGVSKQSASDKQPENVNLIQAILSGNQNKRQENTAPENVPKNLFTSILGGLAQNPIPQHTSSVPAPTVTSPQVLPNQPNPYLANQQPQYRPPQQVSYHNTTQATSQILPPQPTYHSSAPANLPTVHISPPQQTSQTFHPPQTHISTNPQISSQQPIQPSQPALPPHQANPFTVLSNTSNPSINPQNSVSCPHPQIHPSLLASNPPQSTHHQQPQTTLGQFLTQKVSQSELRPQIVN